MDKTPFPLDSLLPLRAVEITLRFLTPVHLHLFHQPALTAFLRTLLREPADYDLLLTLDAPESGRTHYRPGDRYRFALFLLPGGEALLQTALEQLQNLPSSAIRLETALPFRDNLAFCEARDLLQGRVVRTVEELSGYTLESLDREVQQWQSAQFLRLRWRSPARLLRAKEQRDNVKGEARYCRNQAEVSFPLLADRLHDALADLLRRRSLEAPTRGPAPAVALTASDLFWVDSRYQDKEGREQVMGGLMGTVDWTQLQALTPADWRLWVVGQYLGIGQRRAFGWGRYRLETAAGDSPCIGCRPIASLLEQVVERENLAAAYAAIRANRSRSWRLPPRSEEREEEWAWSAAEAEEAEAAEEYPAERLERLAEQLTTGSYQPPALRGVVQREADGDWRALAIPPFFDRVAQRAVAQVLTPGLEPLMYYGSFGYRPRRSRHSARQMIQAAYEEGYRWVYESDVDDFFDSVEWNRLRNRLLALYGDDPLVGLILRWVGAPVTYQNQTIQRTAGLPQGSPLSPLMANLLLDDFDHDLAMAGFRLARFADDFVILCKDREQAEAAAQATLASLAELGLTVNQEKTAIRSFQQGFRYLGYLFVDGLALDVSGQRDGTEAVTAAAAPPRSWLAGLLQREPQALTEAACLPPQPEATGVATTAVPSPVLRLGGEAAGTMLFVTGPLTLLSVQEGRLLLKRDDELLTSLPWSRLQGIVLLGPHQLTMAVIRMALSLGVPVHFASSSGWYQGTLWTGQPGGEGYPLWLAQQACFADPARALAASRQVVEARLHHLREVLRQRAVGEQFQAGLGQIDALLRGLAQADTLSVLHGLEGQGTRVYFEALQAIVPPEFGFDGRNRRPPQDPFNALLSLGYTILYAHVDTVLRACGLLPWVGFYHQGHSRHAVLASDLMEPFRHLVERTALLVLTRRQLKPEDFHLDPELGCRLTPEASKRYLALLAERFATPVAAVQATQAKTLHEHLYAQNQALIAWIRGQVESFRAWRMR